MGADIGGIAEGKIIPISELGGKTFAVDAYNTIYQFLSSIRQPDGTPLMDFKGRVTGHLAGVFYRNAKLIANGIRVAYVFDGKPPSFKAGTIDERQKVKEESEEKWRDALKEGDMEGARKYAQGTSRLTREMVEEAKKLLELMGIPVVQAPSEGEAQAAELAREGEVYAAASQDMDALLFGAPRLLRNLSITGKRKIPRRDEYVNVEPQLIELKEVLAAHMISREQLIWLGILAGTDFNKGIRGIGVKKGLKIVLGKKNLAEVEKFVKSELKAEFEEDIYAVEKFFLEPPVEHGVKVKFGTADVEGLGKFLCDEHDFSHERVDKTVHGLFASQSVKGKQKGLEEWF